MQVPLTCGCRWQEAARHTHACTRTCAVAPAAVERQEVGAARGAGGGVAQRLAQTAHLARRQQDEVQGLPVGRVRCGACVSAQSAVGAGAAAPLAPQLRVCAASTRAGPRPAPRVRTWTMVDAKGRSASPSRMLASSRYTTPAPMAAHRRRMTSGPPFCSSTSPLSPRNLGQPLWWWWRQ
jgi:hypothetical protein